MSTKTDVVYNIKDYLIQENYPTGLLFLLEDYLINKAISKEEINNILALPIDEYNYFISNYTLRGS